MTATSVEAREPLHFVPTPELSRILERTVAAYLKLDTVPEAEFAALNALNAAVQTWLVGAA